MKVLRSRHRLGALIATGAIGAASVVALAASPASATSTPPSTSTCTYTNVTQGGSGQADVVTNVHAGDHIGISCTGLPASNSMAIIEVSPLGEVDAANGASYSVGASVTLANSDASGNIPSATYTVPAFGSGAAGDPNAQCPPTQAQVNAGLVDCILVVADLTAGNVQENVAQLVYPGQPTPQTPALSVTPNTGTGRAGDTFSVSGTGFWGSAFGAPTDNTQSAACQAETPSYLSGAIPAATILVGGVPAGTGKITCTTYDHSTGTLTPATLTATNVTIPAGGDNSGIAVLEPNITFSPGNGPSNTVMGNAAFSYLPATSAAANPTSGGVGVSVSLTGDGFDPQGGTPTVSFSNGTPATAGTATVNSAGHLIGSITVAASDTPGSNDIVISQTAADASTISVTVPFSVLSISGGPCSTTGNPGTCTVNQVITEQVTGVTSGLTIQDGADNGNAACASTNPDNIHVTLTGTTLNGKTQHATGCLNTVQITDARGTLPGWTATGVLETDFLGGTHGTHVWDNVIPGNNLHWTPAISLTWPSAPNGPSGVLSEVNNGPAAYVSVAAESAGLHGTGSPYSTAETTTPNVLCQAPVDGGGTFNCDASLDLTVPAWVSSGAYQSTMDLVVT